MTWRQAVILSCLPLFAVTVELAWCWYFNLKSRPVEFRLSDITLIWYIWAVLRWWPEGLWK